MESRKTLITLLGLAVFVLLAGSLVIGKVKERFGQGDHKAKPDTVLVTAPPAEPEPIWEVRRWPVMKTWLDTLRIGAGQVTNKSDIPGDYSGTYHLLTFSLSSAWRPLIEHLAAQKQEYSVVFKRCIQNCAAEEEIIFDAILADISGQVLRVDELRLVIDTRSALGIMTIRSDVYVWRGVEPGSEKTIEDVKIYLNPLSDSIDSRSPYIGIWDPWPRVVVKTK